MIIVVVKRGFGFGFGSIDSVAEEGAWEVR